VNLKNAFCHRTIIMAPSAAAKAAVQTFAAQVVLAPSGPVEEDLVEECSPVNVIQTTQPELTDKAVCLFYICCSY
jgi:hypothetical protein